MPEETNGASVSFTTKEMLVRMDGKLDVLASRQTHYDVELALLKARADELDREARSSSTRAQEVKAALERSEALMNTRVDHLNKGVDQLGRKLAYATGTIATLLMALEVASRLWLKG